MKIVIISDTHELHRRISLPEGDILIHCGDATGTGNIRKIDDFSNWLSEQPFKHKLFITGNHDKTFEHHRSEREYVISSIKSSGTHYLEDSGIEIDGLYFYGAPWTPVFGNWAFMLPRGEEIKKKWDQIPNWTDVLITHGPPYQILDKVENDHFGNHEYRNIGCEELRRRIEKLPQLKLHCFGHDHQGYGTIQHGKVQYVNAAICDEEYNPSHQPIIIELSK